MRPLSPRSITSTRLKASPPGLTDAVSGSVNPGDAMDRQGTGLSGTPNRVPFGSGVPSSQLLAESFYNGIDRPLNQQIGQQSYLFGQSIQLGSTLVPAGHPHSQPVGGSYDSRLALLIPGEPGGQQPVWGGWPSYGTSVLFTPVLPSGPLHSQPTPSSLAIMPLGGDMGTLQTKSTTDPATTRLIDDLANIKALPLYSIVVQNCISMGNPYCTK
ncbi:hypothetical protein T492DRAFT_963855, partial [Pavlovales sp. CCMP2436]